jgi:hypothetical protein
MIAVVVAVACCVAVQVAWYLFTCRAHRGEHARADLVYSPYALAERVRREQARPPGRHQLDPRRDPRPTGLLSGDVRLYSGYTHHPEGSTIATPEPPRPASP